MTRVARVTTTTPQQVLDHQFQEVATLLTLSSSNGVINNKKHKQMLNDPSLRHADPAAQQMLLEDELAQLMKTDVSYRDYTALLELHGESILDTHHRPSPQICNVGEAKWRECCVDRYSFESRKFTKGSCAAK